MFWLYFELYWVYMVVFLLLLIVIDKIVNWLFEVFSFLFYNCSLCFEWFVAQHGSVFGPCLMALEQHRRMLGLARRGLGIKNSQFWIFFGITSCIFFIVGSCIHYFVSDFEQHLRVLGPCLMALDTHLRMLGQAFASLYYSYYVDALGWNVLFSLCEV